MSKHMTVPGFVPGHTFVPPEITAALKSTDLTVYGPDGLVRPAVFHGWGKATNGQLTVFLENPETERVNPYYIDHVSGRLIPSTHGDGFTVHRPLPIEFSAEHFLPVIEVGQLNGNAVPPGVSVIHSVRGMGLTVRAFFRCGESYSIFPVDVVDEHGAVVPLPSTRGLARSSDAAFAWELVATRRLITIPMARVDLANWADQVLGR